MQRPLLPSNSPPYAKSHVLLRHLLPHSRTLLLALAPQLARKKNARKKKGGKGDIESNNRAAPKVRAPTAETEAGGMGTRKLE